MGYQFLIYHEAECVIYQNYEVSLTSTSSLGICFENLAIAWQRLKWATSF